MSRTLVVSGSLVIAATPAALYDRVSRPALMGRWSPENLGATVRGADGPGGGPGTDEGAGRGAAPERQTGVGDVFDGRNKRGPARWTTRCTVTVADPGRRFAFRVHAIGLRTPRLRGSIATWEYRFEPVPGGTRVTEVWRDDRRDWPDFVANAFDRLATRGHTFAAFQARNIRTTLRNLKRVVEEESG
ncbi:SRPBCC family protein [Streptomyces corynorhini]|uniref:SRPBCC family protein n=1 Tax=Streptomyces corynorhini TaxID=2282652 RepID=A0A370B9Z2_9ACTN|nr:SRPBCC family protein [Streptomyces corynorhini]RDG38451.1 SRPBCC family protein [Streptomyces corynorhini]